MFNKELKFGHDARTAIRHGIDTLADAVGSTLGPNGNLVVIGKYANGKPHVTKDGVTVAKNISFKDEYMDAGAQLIKEAALKQLAVGDGTTTTTVLAQAMIHKIDDILASSAETAGEIKRHMEVDSQKALEIIDKMSRKIESIEDLEKVATISANNDQEIGKLIADTFDKISKDGVITVDESSNIDTTVEVISGMQFDRGFVSPYFCTDAIKNVCVLENPYIFITDEKINLTKDIIGVVEEVYKRGKPLLIIAEDFDTEVINNLAVNLSNGLKVCCVKCPSFGEYRVPMLEDIGIMSNTKLATYANTIEPKDVTFAMLGSVDKAIITSESTTLIGGPSSQKPAVASRISQIQVQLTQALEDPQHSDFMIDYYKKRIARLAGGVAVIHVGGATELERGERKDRIDDAIAATQAAIAEGIVPGGGTVYTFVSSKLEEPIIKDALLSIIRKLAPEDVIERLTKWCTCNDIVIEGYNAKTGEYVSDMFKEGIIDPAKTVKMAIRNAVSVAELYLMTNCVIVPEEIPTV